VETEKPRIAIIVPRKKMRCLGSLLWMQRYGPLQVAGTAQQAGYAVRLFNEEIGPDVSAREIASNFDVVGFSSKSSALSRAEHLARQIRTEAGLLGRQVILVLGGEHASMSDGRRLLDCFDYVLRGEAELAFLELLQDLRARNGKRDGPPPALLPSQGFYQCREFNQVPDFSLVDGFEDTCRGWVFRQLPLIWVLKHRRLPVLSFQGSRGCPYHCSFCPTPTFLQGKEYRRRDPGSAVSCLKTHIARSGIRRVMFEDPTAAIPFDKDCHRFFQSLAEGSLNMRASILVRPDLCRDEVLLKTMRAAGVANLNLGIESLNDETRDRFNKRTPYGTIARALEVFHRHGFTITGLFIVGDDMEDLTSFGMIEKFIQETGIEKWRISPLGQMPEVPDQLLPVHRAFFWDELEPFGKDLADFMNGEYVIIYPKKIRPSRLQDGINALNGSCATWGSALKILQKNRSVNSFFHRIGNNLAHNWVRREVEDSHYVELLKELEKPFYDETPGGDLLREDRLMERRTKRRTWPPGPGRAPGLRPVRNLLQ
jgi:radical SAM superfamily enzyme YgiQ (UPF0313 family)